MTNDDEDLKIISQHFRYLGNYRSIAQGYDNSYRNALLLITLKMERVMAIKN